MKLWKLVEAHHEKLGAALFILPCLLASFVAAGVVYGLVFLIH
jgi:hypothetical protein